MRKKEDYVVGYKDVSKYKTINDIYCKQCSRCKEWKPLNKRYYGTNKNLSDGFNAFCKECGKKPHERISKKKGFNDYEIRGDVTAIFLERKDGAIIETLIDTEDLERIKNMNLRFVAVWDKASNFYYAKCAEYLGIDENGKTKHKIHILHRIIMNAPKGTVVDHINEDNPLDNRKCNLRVTNQRVNTKNRERANKNNKTTGIKNINYIARTDEYWVQFCVNYKRFKWVFPGSQFEEAKKFADEKRIELYGKKEDMIEVDKKLNENVKSE